MRNATKVLLKRGSIGLIASVAQRPEVQVAAYTANEAVGRLVTENPEIFGVIVEQADTLAQAPRQPIPT